MVFFLKHAALRIHPQISLGFNANAGQEVLVTNLPKHNDFHTVDLDNNSHK